MMIDRRKPETGCSPNRLYNPVFDCQGVRRKIQATYGGCGV
jgi:hypothetical protein